MPAPENSIIIIKPGVKHVLKLTANVNNEIANMFTENVFYCNSLLV